MENENSKKVVSVKILNQQYDITCQIDEQEKLIRSAKLLNEKMQDVKKDGKTVGLDRVAIISALNISGDAVSLNEMSQEISTSIKNRIDYLKNKIDEVI
ncbi:MAG: cell division protein ZapA [Pseudomonadota bacterium]|mgnify:CR=1 FL=1|nr:cell division protein ZapA [Pseudomonadota bacterium]|tara:strand:+ start:1716 stop:2012 length:297 start_codon:yes stop_codon:yes gene_type:complete